MQTAANPLALKPTWPADYFEARQTFTAESRRAGAELVCDTIAAPGPDGRTLHIDCAYLGAPQPRRLVILSSGTHGVEGFVGSVFQQLALAAYGRQSWPADAGLLLVHALNPYGFAFLRRVNEHNVDLNRNALATFPGPANPEYRRLNQWLNPDSPPPRREWFWLSALPRLVLTGRARLTQAIAGGQYEFPSGLFYGGDRRQESLDVLARVLDAPRFRNVTTAVHIDIHSGLGRFGDCRLFVEAPAGSPAFAHWLKSFTAHYAASAQDNAGEMYTASGTVLTLVAQAFPRATVHAATMEFGTYSTVRVLEVFRAENRLHRFGAQDAAHAAAIKQRMREVGYPDSERWRASVIAHATRIISKLPGFLAEVSA